MGQRRGGDRNAGKAFAAHMKFLDASVLVEACLLNSLKFRQADALIGEGGCTSAHALAEAYATLSGDKRLRINPHDAAKMVLDCSKKLQVASLVNSEMLALLESAPRKGVSGGSFYDAIHAETARKLGCQVIHTLNGSHFRHVAPDLQVLGL